MSPVSHVDALASFLPWFHVERLGSRGSPLSANWVERKEGAILFVDISGFSRITEQLSQAGAAGAEQLAHILNAYFGRMTNILAAHGGDVLSFAGDAVLGIWLAEDAGLGQATLLAAQAGSAVQRELARYQAMPGVVLKQRASVGAGSLFVSELGGVGGRWKLLVAGDAIEQAGAANEEAAPGEVILSRPAWEQIRQRCRGTPNARGGVRLEEICEPAAMSVREPPPADAAIANLVGSYLPRVVQDRIDAGQTQWLAEFRTISLAFAGLGQLDFEAPETMPRLQEAIAATQEISEHYDGAIHRLLMDDKGTSLILCFGMPPQAHEDDARRVVRAGIALKNQLTRLGLQPSIGIATGRAFCGACGGETRRQYSIYGPVINRAARLMQMAKGQLLCDPETVSAAGKDESLEFVDRSTTSFKGMADSVTVFEPRRRDVSQQIPESHAVVVGRNPERAFLDQSIDRLVKNRVGGVVVLEGEAGIGKSHLMNYVVARAGESDVARLYAAGDEIEKETPFHAWRSVFRTILGIEGASGNLAQNRQRLLHGLARWPDWVPVASLLNLLLPFDLPESELVVSMSEETRAETRQDMLYEFLKDWSALAPTLIAVENAQWLDSGSWKFLERLSRAADLLIVVATRPMDERRSGHVRLLANPGTTQFRLGVLEPEEVVQLVCQRLKVETLPESVARFIIARAEGHPLFSEELAGMLRDVGLVEISGGKCRLVAAQQETGRELAQRLEDQDLPSTVEGVILRRLDELPPSQLLTVKVASALGQSFSYRTLRDVYPVEITEPRLREDLAELCRRQLLAREAELSAESFRFQQAMTVDVAYESMLYVQRRSLHQSIAEWFEREYEGELSRHYPVLAHHWQRAEVTPKAIEYLSRAGEQALESFANREAVRFFSDALQLADRDRTEKEGLERGTGELRLGRAFVNWSKYPEGRAHLEKGLELYGEKVPRGANVLWKFGGQLLRQLMYRTLPRGRTRDPADAGRLREAARAYEALMEIYYSESATTRSLYSALRSLNLAEAAGPSAELARGYGAMGALTGMVGLRRAADRYGQRALQAAQAAGDPSAEAWVALAAGVYQAGLGVWDQAVPMLQRAASIAKRLNDRRRWEDAAIHLAIAHFLQADYRGGLALTDEIYESALRGGDDRGRANALLKRGMCYLRLDRLDRIPGIIEDLASLRRDVQDELQAGLHILRAAFHWQNQEVEEATAEANKALDQINESSLFYDAQTEYSELAIVVLNLAETDSGTGEADREARLTKACRLARNHARLFPVARPAATICEGRRQWRLGHPAKAFRLWRKAVTAARACGLPYEEASAHFEIGRHLERNSPERQEHLEQALNQFRTIEAAMEVNRTKSELALD